MLPKPNRMSRLSIVRGLTAFLTIMTVLAQENGSASVASNATFSFARLEYTGVYDDTSIKNWYTDWPSMDNHLVTLVNRLTNVKADAVRVKPSDKTLFDCPLIYVAEPEQMNLSDADVVNLREYLARGGFIFMDDFHGDDEMFEVVKTVHQILGDDATLDELPLRHEVFHAFFDIPGLVQVVNDGLVACVDLGCEQWENGPTGRTPKVYGVYDARGRMVMLLAYNTDLGDGLEWADDPVYPHDQATYAVKFCVNVIIYALTH